MLFVIVHRYWLTVGTAALERIVLLLTGLGGLWVGFGSRQRTTGASLAFLRWGTVALGLLSLLSGWLSSAVLTLVAALPSVALVRSPVLIPLSVGCVCVLPASWLAGRLLRTLAGGPRQALLAAGCGSWLGLTVLSMLVLPWLGFFWISVVAVVAACLSAAAVLFVGKRGWNLQSAGADVSAQSAQGERWSRIAACCGVFIVGMLTVTAGSELRELIPPAFYLSVTAISAVLLGAALGQHFCKPAGGLVSGTGWSVAAVVWSMLWLMMFPELTDRLLQANAHVSHVGLLMWIRWSALTLCLVPLGVAWAGVAMSAASQPRSGDDSCRVADSAAAWQSIPAFLLGCCASVVLLAADWTVPHIASGIGFAVAASVPAILWRQWSTVRFPTKLALAGLTVFLCVTPWTVSRYSPARAARLLFATSVFQADLDGEERELLQYMDDGRLLETTAGEFGTLTIWRSRGSQIQIREGGVPRSIASGDPRICPDYSAEIVPTIMGLVLHDDPHDVLLLGCGAGATSQVALTFPTRSVHCSESDGRMLKMVRRHVWSQPLGDPEQDERFRLHDLNPLAAVLGLSRSYDVIVSAPSHPSLAQSQPWLTHDFYERVRERLAPGGVFVQRFQQLDFDSRPLRSLVATFQQVFERTCAVEVAPGEIAVFGTDASGFLRPGLVTRMRRPHVQIVLSRLGWDWSMLLDLPSYDHDTLQKFVSAPEAAPRANGVDNGQFAYWLPREMMRWGEKSQEQQAALRPYRGRIAYWLPAEHDELPEIRKRFAELRTQRHLMTQYPDEPWMYRKKLKEHLQTGLRPAVQQVSGSSAKMHPIDRRRKAYVLALADAVQTATGKDIAELASFEFPYDPLLSFFVHQEAAELYGRSPQPRPRLELMHRLHGIHFADPRDRSVRNVAAAIELLASEPDVVDSQWERWDHLNALLQVLKYRWDARTSVPPASPQVALNDVEKSVSAMNRAFDAMEHLAATLGVAPEDWQRRRQYLERNLQRPLRTYRAELIPHQQSELKKQLEAKADGPDEAPLAN